MSTEFAAPPSLHVMTSPHETASPTRRNQRLLGALLGLRAKISLFIVTTLWSSPCLANDALGGLSTALFAIVAGVISVVGLSTTFIILGVLMGRRMKASEFSPSKLPKVTLAIAAVIYTLLIVVFPATYESIYLSLWTAGFILIAGLPVHLSAFFALRRASRLTQRHALTNQANDKTSS